ncbi:hypothetical protein [Sphingomonas hylomeconis]|uniref:Terminase n=1 Tax=Sphingomonas hylomeconis TaxID=1395958 RepID=A0ABV7SZG5_9SPHN|nr:hypothetical protein [Sphingomonas hylomeconis]
MTTSGPDGRIIAADRRTAYTGRKWVRWSKRMKSDFLDHLAATGSIAGAAAAIGVVPSSVYQLRRRDAAFAAAWREAVVLAYDVLETLVLGHVLGGGEGGGGRGERTIVEGAYGPIDIDQALRLLARHRAALRGTKTTGGARIRYATRVETDAAILTALDALARRPAGTGSAPGASPGAGA